MRLRSLLIGVAIVGATIGGLSSAAIGHGKHHSPSPDFALQDVCVFNPDPAPGSEAEPFLWGACDDVQAGVGGVTLTLYVVPN